MRKQKLKNIGKYILIISLLLIPMLLVYYSIIFYNNKSAEVFAGMVSDGKIAGDKDNNVVRNLSDEIPIIPNSEIVSVDKSNGIINMTLSTNKSKEEIQSFYDDYFYVNGWDRDETNTYHKALKSIKLEYNDNVIVIQLTIDNN